MSTAQTTHFGFTEVPLEEKAQRVRGVFDSVASRYDVMNDVMSTGLHRVWKAKMVSEIPLRQDTALLDLAGGTGDIAFRFLERAAQRQAAAEVTVCDINTSMLQEGTKRALDRNLLTPLPSGEVAELARAGEGEKNNPHPKSSAPILTSPSGRGANAIYWVTGNAESLPLPSAQFDACTIAFGIRNVTDIPRALREIYRVLKPGGTFLCLEFANPNVLPAAARAVYDLYSFQVIPRMGKAITGDAESYQYLVESIRRFPPVDRFKAMMEEAGFCRVRYETLTLGVVALHRGIKI